MSVNAKNGYPHVCRFCSYRWIGYKKGEVVSCPRCKRRFDSPYNKGRRGRIRIRRPKP